MNLPQLIFSDIDGVWTDGGMFYSTDNIELKKFNTSDSAGVLMLKELDIPLVIITGENSPTVYNRCKKLKIESYYLGIKNKLNLAREIIHERSIPLSKCAFIGDDINDLPLLREVGLSCCPNNAPDYIKKEVNIVTSKKGGDGAFREFIETVLQREGKLASVIDQLVRKQILNQ